MAVDRLQHISIAGDVLLRSVRRRCAMFDEIANSFEGRNHSLDPVGRLGALNYRAFAERLEHLRRLLLEERLLAAKFADLPDVLEQSLADRLTAENVVLE